MIEVEEKEIVPHIKDVAELKKHLNNLYIINAPQRYINILQNIYLRFLRKEKRLWKHLMELYF